MPPWDLPYKVIVPMIRKSAYLTVLLLLVIRVAVAGASPQDLVRNIDDYLAGQVRTRGIPGLALAVVRNGEVLYQGAFGVSRLGDDEPLTLDHVFHFASVSKPFTATAIMQLVEQGKMNLDDRLLKYLPYFRLTGESYYGITIRQMLNHTSGIPSPKDHQWDSPRTDAGAVERYVRQMQTQRLIGVPGRHWRYSNAAFDVLADVIAKVSGMSFEAYIQKQILAPLGMTQSSFFYPEVDERFRTVGHIGRPARVSDVYPYNRRHAASSTLNASISDMTRWMLANLNRGELNGKRILSAKSHDLLWTPTADTTKARVKTGLSWFLWDLEGRRAVSHGGMDLGFCSYILLLPDDRAGVAAVSNWQPAERKTMAVKVLKMVLNQDPEGPPSTRVQ